MLIGIYYIGTFYDEVTGMELVGASLCVLLHRSQKLDTPGYNLRRALGRTAGRVLLCDKQLMDYDRT
jgi:hypothetical protein